jgi:hypothetical protein
LTAPALASFVPSPWKRQSTRCSRLAADDLDFTGLADERSILTFAGRPGDPHLMGES